MNSDDGAVRGNDEAVLRALNGLCRKLDDHFQSMDVRLAEIEASVDEIKRKQFDFDVRLDKVQAMTNKALSIAHDLRADIGILTATSRPGAFRFVVTGNQSVLNQK